jgi:Holliday junction resolvasome RuvABC ATP-dependent DNA helicase subunit
LITLLQRADPFSITAAGGGGCARSGSAARPTVGCAASGARTSVRAEACVQGYTPAPGSRNIRGNDESPRRRPTRERRYACARPRAAVLEDVPAVLIFNLRRLPVFPPYHLAIVPNRPDHPLFRNRNSPPESVGVSPGASPRQAPRSSLGSYVRSPGFRVAAWFVSFNAAWLALLGYLAGLPGFWQRFVALILLYAPLVLVVWTLWSKRMLAAYERQSMAERFFEIVDDAPPDGGWPSPVLEEYVADLAMSLKGRDAARVDHPAFNGTLLVGPPGSGKTVALCHIAGALRLPVAFLSGPDLLSSIQAGADYLGAVFEKARERAPCIITIDNLHVVGRVRPDTPDLRLLVGEIAFGRLIYELDHRAADVIVIGATDRPDLLDPSLLRPGRFNRIIELEYVTIQTAPSLIRACALSRPVASDFDATQAAALLMDSVGRPTVAMIEQLVNRAALAAARRSADAVSLEDFKTALEEHHRTRTMQASLVAGQADGAASPERPPVR